MEIIAAKDTKAFHQAVLAQVVESKLTRTEIMDLIIERLRVEISEKIRAKQAEHDAIEPKLSPRQAMAIARENIEHLLSRIETDSYGDDQGRRKLKLSVYLPAAALLPKSYTDALDKKAKASAELKELRQQAGRISNGKVRARTELLRTTLEETPEGARILKAIDSLKGSVQGHLVASTA